MIPSAAHPGSSVPRQPLLYIVGHAGADGNEPGRAENSRPLDLTDEGLLADLQDEKEAESLGLSAGHGKHPKKKLRA